MLVLIFQSAENLKQSHGVNMLVIKLHTSNITLKMDSTVSLTTGCHAEFSSLDINDRSRLLVRLKVN